MRLREALIRSVNTAFQRLSCDLGPSAIVDVAERLGVRNQIDRVPAVGLGGSRFGASVLDMASAFATLANDGVHCPARSILRIRDGSGAELPPLREVTIVPDMDVRSRVPSDEELSRRPEGLAERDTGRCFGALSPDVARATTETLQQVVSRTTGRRAQLDRPTAGKTGTTNDETDAWFVGYTPDIAIAVWVGHTEAATPLRNVAGFARVQGGTLPAMIFRIAAERILENVPPTDFPTPGEGIKAGRVPAPARTDPATEPTAEASTAEPDGEPSDPPTTEPDESPSPSGPPCIIVLGSCG